MSNKLPDHLHQQYAKDIEGAFFFGIPLAELSRKDLMVMAVMGWNESRQASERHLRELETLRSLRR